MQKGLRIYYSLGKKTDQIIYQLSCFVGHPAATTGTRKQWNRQTKLEQYLNAFDVDK